MAGRFAETTEPPLNAPAAVEWEAGKGRLILRYHGEMMLDAAVCAENAAGSTLVRFEVKLEPTETAGQKVEISSRQEIATVGIAPALTKTVE